MVLNLFGDLRGFGRCAITNQSHAWTSTVGYAYASGRGVIFSSFAAEALSQMDQEEAYALVQDAFERIQDGRAGSQAWDEQGLQLRFPLQRSY